jgi:hypothetical protein
MVTVACLLWGDWCHPHGEEYVRKLRDRVAENLSIPHEFVCLSDREIDGISTLPLDPKWEWNLNKLTLYAPETGFQGRVLAFDLDVVPMGPLDDLASYGGDFAVCESFGQKGECGGSIIGFNADRCHWLYEKCAANPGFWARVTGGSERMFLRHATRNRVDFWQRLLPGQIASYKRHCKKGVPSGTRAIVFHGKPRPHEVGF